jgi:formylglycine-generating enzyme required for sulfatase activity
MLTSGAVLQGRYRIIRQIGGGGQALVYLAEDTNLGGLRAIKELTPDPNASPQERQAAYDQFQREAQILAVLNHPNLVQVWGHFRVGDKAYLIMDYIDGQTLEEIMDQSLRFLPEAAVLRWAGQLCDVLDYLHQQRPSVIFRDLKPSNVMLDRSDTVKLIDFGIIRLFKTGQTADTVSMGTPGYAPLEQHGRGQTDARSDIYALGATLYHLLTRREPEPAPDRALPGQPDPLQPARVHNPRIRPSTEAVLAKAMAVNPNHRFQSAQEMKRALMGARSAPSAPTPTVTIPRPAARRRIEPRWPLLGLAVFFVVLVWFLMGRGEPGPRLSPMVAPVERVWEKDNSVMVFVPAGEFLMGSKEDYPYDNGEHPQHTVYVSEFWIDKTEVTNEQYDRCLAASVCQASRSRYAGYYDHFLKGADQPAVWVSWHDAQAYCEWARKRLPTEAEWEKAARGTDGRKYPWGNSFDGSKVNVHGTGAGDGYPETAPVGSYPEGASPYGALDMEGNVSEWCQDWYDNNYYASSPQRDPQGPSSGSRRVVRGSACSSNERIVRAAARHARDPDGRARCLGFRCVSQSPVGYDTPKPVMPSPTGVPTREVVVHCATVTEIPQAECEALVTLYNSADGANWKYNDDWLDANTPCSWYGVKCSEGHVIQLNMLNNHLAGTMPLELGSLTKLQILDFWGNGFTGSIPPELGNLTKLRTFRAYGNVLTGEIPPELGDLTDLEILVLSTNHLSGSIPPELGNLVNLRELHLHSNWLSGSIPSELGNLVNLWKLHISNNQQLSGALPRTLTNLTKLSFFYYGGTDLCAPADAALETWLDSIGDLQGTGVTCHLGQ